MSDRFVFDLRFEEGFFHSPPPIVWGARLLPFSYWHKVQLERAQSCILLGGIPSAWDIWIVRQICRSRFPLPARIPSNPSGVWYLFWKICFGWRRPARAFKQLAEYIADYASPPKLWAGKGSSKLRLAEAYAHLSRLSGDRSYMMKAARAEADAAEGKDRDIDDSVEQVAIYVKNAGRPPCEAWNMPLGEIVWYNICFLKQEGGDVPVWTPKDEAAFERNKIERYRKITEIAKDIRAEFPISGEAMVLAHAAVRYWEKVVASQDAHLG